MNDRSRSRQNKQSTQPNAASSTSLADRLECPPELGVIARQEWTRIVGELAALGILGKFDRGPLAIYCEAFATWIEATDAIHKYGTMIKSPNGYPIQSPWVPIANRAADTMLRLSSEFGFTPAARSRSLSYTKHQSMLLEIEAKKEDAETGW